MSLLQLIVHIIIANIELQVWSIYCIVQYTL